MLYIQKKRVSAAVSEEILRVKKDNDRDHLNYKDTQVICGTELADEPGSRS